MIIYQPQGPRTFKFDPKVQFLGNTFVFLYKYDLKAGFLLLMEYFYGAVLVFYLV